MTAAQKLRSGFSFNLFKSGATQVWFGAALQTPETETNSFAGRGFARPVFNGPFPCINTLPPLRVGITPNLPPLAFKQDGKIVGIEADFAQKLGTALGREVKFVQLDWEDQIPALLDGKTDIIMSGMSITKMRQFRVDFCAPYLQGGQMALVRRSDLNSYALGFPLTPPGVIGVEKGTTGQFFAQQEFSRCERKTFSGSEQAVKALKKKQIGLFIGDA